MTLKNQINLKIPSKLKKDYFQKLRSSILLLMLKQETLEPQQFAVDGVTEELARINRISEYLRDIERIKKEMFLAKSLISAIPDNNFIEKHGSTPEEYILYH
ncbi:MAG: hypothetical protein FJZ04_03395, partial [Candidatus Moranbacteria bacterium]|nr:hypothetical protein [Candidatus Moranbacteria bacterium]